MNMKVHTAIRLLAILWGCSLAGCGGGGGGGSSSIDPANADALTAVMTTKSGDKIAIVVNGSPPAASGSPGSPTASVANPNFIVKSGDEVTVPVQFSSVTDSPICTIYMKVKGAKSSFAIELPCPANAAASVSAKSLTDFIPLTLVIPDKVLEGQFCAEVSGKDADGLVSASEEFCVDVQAQSVVGSYIDGEVTATAGASVATLLPNGKFLFSQICESAGGFVTMEFADYVWNPDTNIISYSNVIKSSGNEDAASCGFIGTPDEEDPKPNVSTIKPGNNGSLLIIDNDDGSEIPLVAYPSVNGQLTGAWLIAGSLEEGTPQIYYFYADNTYLFLSFRDLEGNCADGKGYKRGRFSYNPQSGLFTTSDSVGGCPSGEYTANDNVQITFTTSDVANFDDTHASGNNPDTATPKQLIKVTSP